MIRILRFSAPLLAVLLAGCSHDLVVVLPDADGHVGGVVVQTGDGKTVLLDKAYASDAPGDGKAGTTAAGDIQKDFADVIAARPIPPGHHKLYFLNDSDEMRDDSKTEYNEKVFADIKSRAAAEIVIVGHTDRTGSPDHNDQLSQERAEAIKTLLSQRKSDLPPDMKITTDGRGERDDKDAPGTANPAERYVDIIVQ
jgi:outer membrane protein OmpA-like peptidoglycan-associated protein